MIVLDSWECLCLPPGGNALLCWGSGLFIQKACFWEVKHTSRVEYAISGLRELIEYMKFVKDQDVNYLETE